MGYVFTFFSKVMFSPLVYLGIGRLLDYDYAKIAKTHLGNSPIPGLEHTTHGFPIEAARLRSALYLVFLAINATIGYGWAIQYRVVCSQAGLYTTFPLGLSNSADTRYSTYQFL